MYDSFWNIWALSVNLLVAQDYTDSFSPWHPLCFCLIINDLLVLSGMSKDDAMTAYIKLGKEVISKYGM